MRWMPLLVENVSRRDVRKPDGFFGPSSTHFQMIIGNPSLRPRGGEVGWVFPEKNTRKKKKRIEMPTANKLDAGVFVCRLPSIRAGVTANAISAAAVSQTTRA